MEPYEENVANFLTAAGTRQDIAGDPIVMAAEAAVWANQPIVIASNAAQSLPVNATSYERGLAAGIALTLAARH